MIAEWLQQPQIASLGSESSTTHAITDIPLRAGVGWWGGAVTVASSEVGSVPGRPTMGEGRDKQSR